ncbi:MAG: class II D-tagatose-bisphosphate aldolase, non-catalytic subunit [Lachnospiraceae bacterium]
MKDVLRNIITKRNKGIHSGIPSYCTANSLVIEAILEQAQRFDDSVIIEATANQVNQFGGYTGMKPQDFADFVYEIANNIGFDLEHIILGGDHLGPLTWSTLSEEEAMRNSIELVQLFVKAGFKKIHLDTSMKLGSDSPNTPLSDQIIAQRGVLLYMACEEAFQELLQENPQEAHPVFIIGSEVPIPGGAKDEETVQVTNPLAFESTVQVYKETFLSHGITNAFDYIIAVVVQPGVEFGDTEITHYNSFSAKKLCNALKNHPNLVFEGHSTDYQTPEELKKMVTDGIAILKVGPALTFSLREGLFSLSAIENELIPEEKRSHFIEILEQVMLDSPVNWKTHYHGTDNELQIKRKYSFSDRSRYYMNQEAVQNSIDRLFHNLDETGIPLSMLHQFLPLQYIKVRDGKLPCNARALAKDCVVTLVDDYNYAVKTNYMIGSIFA